MESNVTRKKIRISGMTCVSCQNKIEKKLRNTAGVKSVRVSYSAGNADITYDTGAISFKQICTIIEKLDYHVLSDNEKSRPSPGRVAGILIIVAALYVVLQQTGVLNLLAPGQLANSNTGYGMLFVIGLITSIHCVAMCGGINLSQCLPQNRAAGLPAPGVKQSRFSTFVPAFLYNLGRVISYTCVGFVLGFAGLAIGGGGSAAGLPVMAQGILKLAAGVFMVIMGINMLGIFPWLRKLQPQMPKFNTEKSRSKSPLIVGLLNGLMPCGPLQSMQIVALASGSPFAGALSMFLFSLGTVPLMLGLGSLVSALGKKFTQRVMSIGAVLVVVLGISMLSQGGSLTGFMSPNLLLTIVIGVCAVGIVSCIPFRKLSSKTIMTVTASIVAVVFISLLTSVANASVNDAAGGNVNIADGKQVVASTLSSGSYPDITVRVGTPVKWTIQAPQGSINGCNNKLNIQEFGITNYQLKEGDNIIEFTPKETGKFDYSCWMGMIHGTITVAKAGDALAATDQPAANGNASNGSSNAQSITPSTSIAANYQTATVSNGKQTVTAILGASGYPTIVVQKGIPVEYDLKADSQNINGCNGTVTISQFGVTQQLKAGDNIMKFTPTSSGTITYTCWMGMQSGQIIVVDDLSKETSQNINSAIQSSGGTSSGGGCCGGSSQATKFAGGKIPVDQVEVAQIKNGEQDLTVTVNAQGYTPAVLVVQKGIKTKITFNPEALSSCNSLVIFPEYNGELDLNSQTSTPLITPTADFTFQCGMGMLHGYVKVVDDISNINLDQIKNEISQYKAAGGGGCCG